MNIYYSDEENRLTPEIRELMQKAADEAIRFEFGDELAEAGLAVEELSAELGVTVVDGAEIRELNREYRETDRVTDVLSFPQYQDRDELAEALLGEDGIILAGDVVLCYDRAAEQAEEYGTGIVRELVYLFVHSVFHLFGYDHMDEDERREMRSREEKVLESIGVTRTK